MALHHLFARLLVATAITCKTFAHPLNDRLIDDWTDWDSSDTATSTPSHQTYHPTAISPCSSSTQTVQPNSTACQPCASSSVNSSSSSTNHMNLIGIPQAGDIAILSNDIPLPQGDVQSLSTYIEQVLVLAGLGSANSSSSNDSSYSASHLIQWLTNVLNQTGDGWDSMSVALPAPELSTLFDACFEDERCMFFNTTTFQVVDIFRYMARADLMSTAANPWTPLAKALITQDPVQVVGLGVVLATNFTLAYTSGALGMYFSFQSDGIRASAPGFLHLVDAYTINE